MQGVSEQLNPQRTKVFLVTLRTKGNSETKKARTMKLCKVIAYYINSIKKELKFLNSNCSIVCSFCCVLDRKNEIKNDRIFKFFEIKRNSRS